MAHVLLLEPNTLLAASYTAALQHMGHTVDSARTGQQAIYTADARTPDVVILELQLPRHNGIEFLYEFRSYIEWQEIPVIVHTVLAPLKMQALADALYTSLRVETTLYKPATTLQELCRQVHVSLLAAA